MDATKEDPSLTPTSKDDLRSCIQKDLSQFFFANNLNALANGKSLFF